MSYSRLNNLTGWGVFVFALIVYLSTMAPTASYWDCGEFIACANELEVPHPPGAPFFLLLGRVFAIFAFNDVEQIAFMLNLMSVLASSFTVLFTFWITTHLGEKLLERKEKSQTDKLVLMGAGIVGGMACTFASSFWFNAVEAEVYALSSFFTAVVVWLMFKWEERADEPGNERWIILIAYLMGLSIGVHLLNLLTIPALAFIYYFKKYDFSWSGFLITGAISVLILGVIQTGIILYTFDFAWAFERFFVGTLKPGRVVGETGLGMPVGSGVIIFFLLLFGGIVATIYYSQQKNKQLLNVAMLCVVVIFIGFSSYLMVPIRSNANPPIDENNPDNTQTFLSYMKREQYGDRPLLFGPLYNAAPIGLEEIGPEYSLDETAGKYKVIGTKRRYEYSGNDKILFPRMYDQGRYNMGPHAYANYVKRTGKPETPADDKPTTGENFRFFLDYQVRHMYVRYFMWNFAGRELDYQDADWESGLNFSQTARMPDFLKNHPAKNHYYMLPFLLGLLGLVWQARQRSYDATVVGLLFFFTGLAIILYLNQYPAQPRERDYSFAGSFQTYAIWIGLGVIALYELVGKYLKGAGGYVAIGLGLIPPLLMGIENWDDHSRAGRYTAPDSAYNLLNSLAPNAVVFTNGDNDTFPLWYLQEVEGVRPDVRVLCLSYVNTDWYIDQMYQKVNQSDPLPLSLDKSKYVGQKNQSLSLGARKTLSMRLPVNVNELMADSTINSEEQAYAQSPLAWEVPTRGGGNNRYFELKDVLILNLLENTAKGGWKRPIYFANTVSPSSFLGLQDYLRLEGLAYRILPVKNPAPDDPYDPYDGSVDPDRMYKNLTQVFKYRNLNNPDVYYDENIGRMMVNYHSVFYRLSNDLLRRAEKKENRLKALEAAPAVLEEVNVDQEQAEIDALKARAKEVMNFSEEKFPYEAITPDPFILVRAGIMFDRLGENEKAEEYFAFAKERSLETLKYYEDEDFKKKNDYMVGMRMLLQHYSVTDRPEDLQTLQEELSTLNILTSRR